MATDGFEIILEEDTLQSNAYMFLGGADEYGEIFPDLPSLFWAWGLFHVEIDEAENLVGARIL